MQIQMERSINTNNRTVRIGIFGLFVIGILGTSGCVSRYQLAMERAVRSQESRYLEDELYQTYQELDELYLDNQRLRNRLEEVEKRKTEPEELDDELISIPPIRTEEIEPAQGVPKTLQKDISLPAVPQGKRIDRNPNMVVRLPNTRPVISRPPPPVGFNGNLPQWSPHR